MSDNRSDRYSATAPVCPRDRNAGGREALSPDECSANTRASFRLSNGNLADGGSETGEPISVDRNKHWASDVFVGAAIGYFVGKVVTRVNPFLKERNLSFRPFAETGEYGTAIVHRF